MGSSSLNRVIINKTKNHTHTSARRADYSSVPEWSALSWHDSLSNKRTKSHTPSAQERNTQVISIIYLQSQFPQQTFLRLSWGGPQISTQDGVERLEGGEARPWKTGSALAKPQSYVPEKLKLYNSANHVKGKVRKKCLKFTRYLRTILPMEGGVKGLSPQTSFGVSGVNSVSAKSNTI